MKTALTILALTVALTACGGSSSKSIPKPAPIPDQKPKSALLALEGTWIEQGEASAIQITEHGMTVFSYSSETCSYTVPELSLDIAETMMTEINQMGDQDFSFIESGNIEHFRRNFIKHPLPQACVDLVDKDINSPEYTFEHIWHTFNDYYAFFELRSVNWQESYDKYRPLVTANTNQEELFNIISSMLVPLNDAHVGLTVNSEEYSNSDINITEDAWLKIANSLVPDNPEYKFPVFSSLQESFVKRLFSTYPNENISSTAPYQTHKDIGDNEALNWGILENNIGYIQLNTLMGYTEQDPALLSNIAADLERFEQVIDNVLNDLAVTESIIVDLRFNLGGWDPLSLAFASRFADKERTVLTKSSNHLGEAVQKRTFSIRPNARVRYNKAVHVITGKNTASGGEILAMAMKTLPQANIVGENTMGILSDTLEVEINDHWNISLSNQTYVSPAGNVYEADGVPVDIAAPTASRQMVEFGAFPAVRTILEKYGHSGEIDQTTFETIIEQILEDNSIPSLSIAWTDKNGVIASQSFGYANIENKTLATPDTPYPLGSTSKSFIAVAASQMIEKELISMDSKLADIDLPFNIESPYFNSDNITLKNLVSHTSGIIDNDDSYQCGYHLISDRSSLVNAIKGKELCPNNLGGQAEFLNQYLSSDGLLYSEENFTEAQIGENYDYTNIGAAVTAEVLAAAAGVPLNEWNEQNIFAPLGMNATHYFVSEYSENVISPVTRYVFADGEMIELPTFELTTWSDGNLKSSVNDLAQFLTAIVNSGEVAGTRILSTESVTEMLSAKTALSSDEGSIQASFWIKDNFMFGHNGSDPGTDTEFRYDMHNNLGIIMLQNGNNELDDLEGEALMQYENSMIILKSLIYRRGLTLKNEQEIGT
jgi:CubicO group peptidase (beta-lactamase class C family)